MDSIELVKWRLLDEFEAGQRPDIASYVRRHPQYRQELLDFWVVLASSQQLSEMATAEADVSPLTRHEEEIVRDLCLAVSIGPAWLEQAVDEGGRDAAAVGAELLRIRRTPYEFGGTANLSWRRIAVYAWLANRAATEGGTVSRLELQKLAYLLEQAMSLGIFTKHKKYRLGPYDPAATYRDAEPKCVEKEYLVRVGRYDFRLGDRIGEALEYAGRYLRDEAVAEAFLQVLSDLDLDMWRLETLATVHAVAVELMSEGAEVSVDGVRTTLAKDKTWSKKLDRQNFTADRISAALETLALLQLLDQGFSDRGGSTG